MWKEDKLVKCVLQVGPTLQIGPSEHYHWECLKKEGASQSSIYVMQPGAPTGVELSQTFPLIPTIQCFSPFGPSWPAMEKGKL